MQREQTAHLPLLLLGSFASGAQEPAITPGLARDMLVDSKEQQQEFTGKVTLKAYVWSKFGSNFGYILFIQSQKQVSHRDTPLIVKKSFGSEVIWLQYFKKHGAI